MDSTEHFRKIFLHSNDAIFVIDPKNDAILDVNNRACKMLGYSRKELLSKTISDIHPDEMPELMEFCNKVFKKGKGWTSDLTCTTKRGEKLPAEISASQFKTKNGQYMVAMVRDISVRKAIEQQLTDSEQKYRDIFESAYDMIFLVNSKGNILEMNRRGEKLTGYKRKRLCQMNVFEHLIIPEDQPNIKQVFTDVVNGKERIYEVRWKTKSGKIIHFEGATTSRFSPEGKFLFTRCILRDITGRKKVEMELKAGEERYRTLVDTIQEGLIMVDQDGIIQYVNKPFCKLLGYTEAEIVGQKAVNPKWLDPEQFMFIQEKLKSRKKGFTDSYELRFHTKKGEKRWALVSGAPLYDAKENVIGSLSVNMDITRMKRAEKELKERYKQLRKYTFLTSHGLRRPVTSILGLVELLQSRKPGEPIDEQLITLLKTASEEMEKVTRETTEILTKDAFLAPGDLGDEGL